MPTRIMAFVDYWNFQLGLNLLEARDRGLNDFRFKVDWFTLGQWLAKKACGAAGLDPAAATFEGVTIYTSFNPSSEEGKKFRGWATGTLARQPGVRVECRERRSKQPPRCPACYQRIETCPHCSRPIQPTVEKGVDTLIATDMIRLAWENAYDLAVLATSDADLVPAVEFLRIKAQKVVQAGFPPHGTELATACWASFDVGRSRHEIARP